MCGWTAACHQALHNLNGQGRVARLPYTTGVSKTCTAPPLPATSPSSAESLVWRHGVGVDIAVTDAQRRSPHNSMP